MVTCYIFCGGFLGREGSLIFEKDIESNEVLANLPQSEGLIPLNDTEENVQTTLTEVPFSLELFCLLQRIGNIRQESGYCFKTSVH